MAREVGESNMGPDRAGKDIDFLRYQVRRGKKDEKRREEKPSLILIIFLFLTRVTYSEKNLPRLPQEGTVDRTT